MQVGARTFRDARESIEYCHQLGVDTAILECNQIPGWGEREYLKPDAISETLEILDKGGISCPALIGGTIPVIGRTPQDNEILQNTIKTIHAMGKADVPILLLFMLEEVEAGADREALWPFFVNHYRHVVDAAAEADVNIAMHGYFPPMGLVDGAAFFARSFAELPDSHNGICYDPGNMAICGDDPLEELEAFKERIYLVHIRDVNGDWKSVENIKRNEFQLQVFPGRGIAKAESVIQRLCEIGYPGVIQPEHFGPPGEAEQLPAAIKYLQDVIENLEHGTAPVADSQHDSEDMQIDFDTESQATSAEDSGERVRHPSVTPETLYRAPPTTETRHPRHSTESRSSFYVAGGVVEPDAPSCIDREADSDLYDGLKAGELCYVLGSLQTGKSSLMGAAATWLREDGTAVAMLELGAIDQNLTAEQWYHSLLSRIGEQLDLASELEDFWLGNAQIEPPQRWLAAIRTVALARYEGQFVIFIDDIDTVARLSFSTDAFFAAIGEYYQQRTVDAELERLTFCLLGAGEPSDLIDDTGKTPLDIARRIVLTDFTPAEATVLGKWLGDTQKNSKALLKRVLYWTGGHPYLTQRLCQAVTASRRAIRPANVDHLCDELFFFPEVQDRDENLSSVRKQMLDHEEEHPGLLELYRHVRRGGRVRAEKENPTDSRQLLSIATEAQMQKLLTISILQRSGITRDVKGNLRVRNRIYARVFDTAWVQSNMQSAGIHRPRFVFRLPPWRRPKLLSFATEAQITKFRTTTAIVGGVLAMLIILGVLAWQGQDQVKGVVARAQGLFSQISQSEGEVPSPAQTREQEQASPAQLAAQKPVSQGQTSDRKLSSRIQAKPSTQSPEKVNLLRLRRYGKPLQHKVRVNAVVFSADGRLFATASKDTKVRLWDVSGSKTEVPLLPHRVFQHQSGVLAAAFSPDGKFLATASRDKTTRLWNVASGKQHGQPLPNKGFTTALAFSPDGKLLATVSGGVRLWDVASGKQHGPMLRHKGQVMGVAFSPDGTLLATASKDQTARLWDVSSGKPHGGPLAHEGEVTAVAFNPDGTLLATASKDQTARLWDVSSGKPHGAPLLHQDWVLAIAFSPDGTLLASASKKHATARWWNVSTGRPYRQLSRYFGWTRAFSPDGKLVATMMKNEVQLWHLPVVSIASRDVEARATKAQQVKEK